ncbi:MAG: hypothetical protein P4L55_10590 [Syntrophobacteraceae bacterium]|nr:hypothetical protein [Syntrophobacteraceae bacterium]
MVTGALGIAARTWSFLSPKPFPLAEREVKESAKITFALLDLEIFLLRINRLQGQSCDAIAMPFCATALACGGCMALVE